MISIRSNENNPNNIIKKIKIATPILNVSKQFRQKHHVQSCEILLPPEEKKPRIFIFSTKKDIITSIKKARQALLPIRKHHIFDVMTILQSSQKKVAKLMISTVRNIIRHAMQKGRDPIRLFLHGYIICKKRRIRGLRYHAKGRIGREKKDFCQVKLLMYEKDKEQFFEDVGVGKSAPGYAQFVRSRLIQENSDYEKIAKFSGITTSKGRQQKRELLRRKVDMMMKQNEKNNVFVPRKVLQKEVREEEGKKAEALFDELKYYKGEDQLKKREKLFKKNLGIE